MKQRDVEQQNADTRDEIEQAARRGRSDERPPWLNSTLQSHGLDPDAGILAEYAETPDQEGIISYGTWLTASREFWAFEVLVPYDANEAPVVETFENITESTSVSPHMRGIGKSFGALAIEVLTENFAETERK